MGRRALAAVGVCVLSFAGLGMPAPAARADDGPTVRVGYTGDLDSLNPFVAILATSTEILGYQYEPLVRYAVEDNSVAPGLAETWEATNGARTWTFHLDPAAKWSDGEPVTAHDVVWTVEAIANNAALKRMRGSLVRNVKTVTSVDDRTVVVDLTEPQASNPGTILPVVPEHIWSKIDDPASFANDSATVGSGPFVISKHSPASGVELTANQYYRLGPPKVAGVKYSPYQDTDFAVAALKASRVDMVRGLSPQQFIALPKIRTITAIAGTGHRYVSLSINPGAVDITGRPMGDGNAALRNPAVRRAIVRAIDNNALLQDVVHGLGDPGTGIIPPAYPLYDWVPDTLPLSFDPQAANKLLDDAGYPTGPGGLRRDRSGTPLQLRILGRSSDPTHQRIVDHVVPWLRNVGIALIPEMKDPAQVNSASTRGNYDLYINGWGIAPDPDYQLSLNLCSSRPNADGTGATSESNWCSPEFDELYKKQHSELDQKKRTQYVIDAQKLIYDAAVNDVLFYPQSLQAFRSDRFSFVDTRSTDIAVGSQNPSDLYLAAPVAVSDARNSGKLVWWLLGGAGVVAAAVVIVAVSRRAASRP